MTEPLRVIPLEYAGPELQEHPAWRHATRWCVLLGCTCCLIAWFIIVIGLGRSVLVTGPIIFSIGIVIIVGGNRLKLTKVIILGTAHVGICLLFFGLVNILHWGPTQAATPFTVMGLIYCLAITFLTIRMLQKLCGKDKPRLN